MFGYAERVRDRPGRFELETVPLAVVEGEGIEGRESLFLRDRNARRAIEAAAGEDDRRTIFLHSADCRGPFSKAVSIIRFWLRPASACHTTAGKAERRRPLAF